MRAVVQRVSSASVRVEGETVGACGRGLLVLVGVRHEDTSETAARLAAKIARLRIFENEEGRFDRSIYFGLPSRSGRRAATMRGISNPTGRTPHT